MLFQSTHSLRSATRQPRICRVDENVSIHALLAECDRKPPLLRRRLKSFNPRTPCGVRLANLAHISLHDRFQSTHSLRSATFLKGAHIRVTKVSIHALLAECDPGATPKAPKRGVSIHALLAECDRPSLPATNLKRSFNPRTPCGVRLVSYYDYTGEKPFQSTHSLRSATSIFLLVISHKRVSIHALLAECDNSYRCSRDMVRSFNPRTPCGVRLPVAYIAGILGEFQSTHSLRSATISTLTTFSLKLVSIHALLAECDGDG